MNFFFGKGLFSRATLVSGKLTLMTGDFGSHLVPLVFSFYIFEVTFSSGTTCAAGRRRRKFVTSWAPYRGMENKPERRRSQNTLLLMEEILHQLIGSFSHYL